MSETLYSIHLPDGQEKLDYLVLIMGSVICVILLKRQEMTSSLIN